MRAAARYGSSDSGRGRWSRVVAVGLGLLLMTTAAVTVAPSAQAAAPSITGPTSGQAGAQAVFSGASWAPYANVNLFLVRSTSTFFCTVRADSTGTVAPQSCALPAGLPASMYTVHADDGNGHTADASGMLNLLPSITLTSTFSNQTFVRVQAGDTLRIAGNGFAASSTIATFKLGPTTLPASPASPPTTTQGSFSRVTLTIPSAQAAGPAVLKATDALGNVGSYTITVYRATVVAPTKGAAEAPIVISGAGWPVRAAVNAYLSTTANTFFCSLQALGDGSIPAQSCLLPSSLPAGSYTLLLSDGGVTVRQPFALNPSVTTSSTFSSQVTATVAAGSTLRLNGAGYAANSTIASAKLGTKNLPLTPSNPPTSAAGQFSGVTVTIPTTTAAGAAKLTVKDAAGNAAVVTLTVYQATVSGPANGAAGTPAVISGGGWPALDPINVYLSGASNTFFCSLQSDGAGAIAPQACNLPTSLPAGSYALTLSDGSVTATRAFTLKASISVTNTSGQPMASGNPGDAVHLAGNGFSASSTITTVKLGTKKISTVPAVPTTSTAGQFNGVTFAVPSVAAGTYTLTVTDANGVTATVQFSVT